MNALLLQLMQAVAPSILKIIGDEVKATGTLPTEAELQAKIIQHADAIISKGEEWLKIHPE